MLAKEVRELRVYLLVTAIVAFFLKTGLMLFWHWTVFVHNVRYLIFG